MSNTNFSNENIPQIKSCIGELEEFKANILPAISRCKEIADRSGAGVLIKNSEQAVEQVTSFLKQIEEAIETLTKLVTAYETTDAALNG